MAYKMPILGRTLEIELLSNILTKSLESKGQTVIITGEAGIGKSTLVDFLKNQSQSKGMTICIGESTMQDSSVPYLPFQRALSRITNEILFQTEEFSYFDEIFLISKIGLLISHISRTKDKGMDEDILGSMLTAVQDFVKDSFGDGGEESQKGGLGKLEYLDTKIFIEHGDLVYLAVVTSGEEHPNMKSEIRRYLAEIETNYYDVLTDWDGDIDSLSGSIDILNQMVDIKFRVKRSLENLNIETERLKTQNRILEIIANQSQNNGLVLVIEDAHWADESSLHVLPFLARNIADLKILICITMRPDALENADSVIRLTLEKLSKEKICSEMITLNAIDMDSLTSIVSNILSDSHPPEDLINNLKIESDGNPFFIIEAVRALISDGTLYKDDDVWVLKHGPKSKIPHSVSELVSRRLESLDLDSLRVIEYAAVLGRRFSKSLLSTGFRMGPGPIDLITDSLRSQDIFTQLDDDELVFQHSTTQEVIYSGMSERWKKAYHKNAGQMIEMQNHNNIDKVLFNLAYHYSRAQDYEKGIDYCISAGYKASNNLAPIESIQYFENAIALITLSGREDSRYNEIHESLGELFELDGNYKSAIDSYEKILALSPEIQQVVKLLMKKGRVFQAQGIYDEAISTFEQGIALAEKANLNFLESKINAYLGKIYLRKGQYDKSLELQTNYLKESQVSNDKKEIGQAYMNLGGVYWHMNDHKMTLTYWEKSLAMFETIDYDQGIANIHDNLGVGYSTIGEFQKSLDHYMESEKIMLKIGDVKGLSMVLLNIGVLYNRMGKPDKALDSFYKSLQLKIRIGDNIGAANVYNNMGYTHHEIGNFSESKQNFLKNLEIMELRGDVWGVSQALRNLAEAEIELSNISEAERLCDRSIEMAQKHDFKEILSSNLRLKGIICTYASNYESADEYFDRSLTYATETKEPQRIGMVHFSQARSFAKRGDHGKALDSYAKALEIFEKSTLDAFAKKTRTEMNTLINKHVTP